MPIQYCISPPSSSNLHYRHRFLTLQFKVSATCISPPPPPPPSPPPPPQSPPLTRRRAISLFAASSILYTTVTFSLSDSISRSKPATPDFFEIENSGGVKALDLRVGDGTLPLDGDQVSIHYYGRLAAKQGWRFDSTYDHKDQTGEPIPFTFILGSSKVISGIEASVRSMKVGGIRRVIIPPFQGYQNMNQEPIPPNFFDRQRLFTTIFNPTRLSNGEGSTLGTLIFDIELVRTRHS